INMGIRYDFFRVTLNSNNLYESEAIWKVMLSNLSNTTFEELNKELILNWDTSVIEKMISILKTKFQDVNMNLGYTVMTIVFVSSFVVCGFVPLAYWMCELSKKRQKKVKKEKPKKEVKPLNK
ncbi:MAG: hypothetical protein K2L64_03420, partial [Ureaplasma sp.]|nr:hypothetical protein [Ureaplasma sp.]